MTRKQLFLYCCMLAALALLAAACTVSPPAALNSPPAAAAEAETSAEAATAAPTEEPTSSPAPAETRTADLAAAASPLAFKGHDRDIWDVAISPDGTRLATSSSDGTARLWDLATGEQLLVLAPQAGPLETLDFSPDGKYLLTSAGDGAAYFWDAATGEEVRTFPGQGGDAVFSPDGTRVASNGGPDFKARIWDAATGETLHELSGHTDFIPRIAYSPDGKYVLTGSVDQTARVWDAVTGEMVHVLSVPGYAVSSVAFSPDGKYAATGSDDHIARIWDVASGELVREFSGHEGYINGLNFSPDGKYLLTGSQDVTARLWDVATGELVHVFKGATGDVQNVVFSPDRRLVAAASNDGVARTWDLQAALAQDAQGEPLTLRLAIADGGGVVSEPYILEFIDQVESRSNGKIVVEPIWEAGNVTDAGFETGVIQLVKQGRAELGLAATRAFDSAGIMSFQALQAPFLVDNDALAETLATNDIARGMLNDLAAAGLTGLTIWPEDLRHPFSLIPGKPWLLPDDFAGKVVRTSQAELSHKLIKAFGATPIFGDGYQAAESGLRQGASLSGPATATGNVTFFAKFQALFANADALAQLSADDRTVLREAAAAVQAKALSEHQHEEDAAAAWCADGGTIVLASDEQVAAFMTAAQPIYDLLAQDPQQAEQLAALRELKASVEPSVGAPACAPGS